MPSLYSWPWLDRPSKPTGPGKQKLRLSALAHSQAQEESQSGAGLKEASIRTRFEHPGTGFMP